MGIIKISQQGYINDILQKYCVPDDSKTLSNDSNSLTQCVPTHQGTFIPECGEEDKVVDDKLKKKFQSQIGALWWLAGISRPDIFYSVHQCSKLQNKPNKVLEKCLKKIFDYLSHTRHIGVVYNRDNNVPLLSGYADAAFASEDESVSRTGYFYLFKGNLVSFRRILRGL